MGKTYKLLIIIAFASLSTQCVRTFPVYTNYEKLKVAPDPSLLPEQIVIDDLVFYAIMRTPQGQLRARLPYNPDSLYSVVELSLNRYPRFFKFGEDNIERVDIMEVLFKNRARHEQIISLAQQRLSSATGGMVIIGIEYTRTPMREGGGIGFSHYTGMYGHNIVHRLYLVYLEEGRVTYFDEINRRYYEETENVILLPFQFSSAVCDSLLNKIVASYKSSLPEAKELNFIKE